MIKKYLHITEYSSLIPYKIPNRKVNEYDLEYNGNIIRTSVDTNKEQIKESLDTIFDESKIYEKTIPLDDIVIYDNLDIINEDQKVAYIFECPVCLEKTITTDATFNYCPHCENTKFQPLVIGLMNLSQMEEIAVEDADSSSYIQVEGDKIVVKLLPEDSDKQKESIFE